MKPKILDRLLRDSLWEARQRNFRVSCSYGHRIKNKLCSPFGALVMAWTGDWSDKTAYEVWKLFFKLEAEIFGAGQIRLIALESGLKNINFNSLALEGEIYHKLGKKIAEDFNLTPIF